MHNLIIIIMSPAVTLLITGGAGYVSSVLVDTILLKSRNNTHNIINTNNSNTTSNSNTNSNSSNIIISSNSRSTSSSTSNDNGNTTSPYPPVHIRRIILVDRINPVHLRIQLEKNLPSRVSTATYQVSRPFIYSMQVHVGKAYTLWQFCNTNDVEIETQE